MFELITISNGVAVVQHTSSGHVYRFRPKRPGFWRSLTLNTIDPRDDADHAADHDVAAACAFAEDAAAFCSTASVPAQWAVTTQEQPTGTFRRTVAALWER